MYVINKSIKYRKLESEIAVSIRNTNLYIHNYLIL